MSRKTRSKFVGLDDDFYGSPSATVEPLHLSELKLKCGGVTAYIDQLFYKGAPNYLANGQKKKMGWITSQLRAESNLLGIYTCCQKQISIALRKGIFPNLSCIFDGSIIPKKSLLMVIIFIPIYTALSWITTKTNVTVVSNSQLPGQTQGIC